MIVLITIPTFARDVRPGNVVHHESQPWEVDEVAHQRDGSVKIAVRPTGRERDGRRTIITTAGETFVQVLPTREQADQLAPVIADALGTSWCTLVHGLTVEHPDHWDEVLTEEGGVEWNPATGQVDRVVLPEQPRRLVHELLDLTDIAVVDVVLAAVDAAHPTAIADHLRSAERADDERRALAEMTPEQAAVGVDSGDIAVPALIVPPDATTCPETGMLLEDCTTAHVHLRANAEPLTDAERRVLGMDPIGDGETDQYGDAFPGDITDERDAR